MTPYPYGLPEKRKIKLDIPQMGCYYVSAFQRQLASGLPEVSPAEEELLCLQMLYLLMSFGHGVFLLNANIRSEVKLCQTHGY